MANLLLTGRPKRNGKNLPTNDLKRSDDTMLLVNDRFKAMIDIINERLDKDTRFKIQSYIDVYEDDGLPYFSATVRHKDTGHALESEIRCSTKFDDLYNADYTQQRRDFASLMRIFTLNYAALVGIDKSFSTPEIFDVPSDKDIDERAKQNIREKERTDDFEPIPEIAEHNPYKSPAPSAIEVYVDGSYNNNTNEYGYGVYMTDGQHQRVLFGKGECKFNGRNVEGEVAGARAALDYIASHKKDKSVILYYDYQGIGSWADGKWKTNKSYTREYADFVEKCRLDGMVISFNHAKGHSGIEGNEYVDKIAKIACGISLTKGEYDFLMGISDVKGMPDMVFSDDAVSCSKVDKSVTL